MRPATASFHSMSDGAQHVSASHCSHITIGADFMGPEGLAPPIFAGLPRLQESPGIFIGKFRGPGKSWKMASILESPGIS